MAESYEGGNGDYSTYNEEESDYNKQRKCVGGVGPGPHNGDHENVMSGIGATSGDSIQLNEKANEYIRDCLTEKNRMDRKFPIAEKLLDSEIEKVQATGRIPTRDQKYADIYREKPIRISQKVLVPIREHPKFNFVGKLLGPKGNSLRRLQEETLCKMTVLGRNSMRDRIKEEELRSSKDPKYAHLNSDLHVEISTIAPPAEAYARIAYAMAELRKYLIPDSNDTIRQEQLRELMDSTTISDDPNKSYKKGNPNQLGAASSGGPPVVGINKGMQHHGYRSSQPSQFAKNAVSPKQKVLSILEKARTAMDETRGYENQLSYEHQPYDSYSFERNSANHPSHSTQATGIVGVSGIGGAGARGPYDSEYETDYNRREYYQHSSNYGGGGLALSAQQGISGLNPSHNRSHVNR